MSSRRLHGSHSAQDGADPGHDGQEETAAWTELLGVVEHLSEDSATAVLDTIVTLIPILNAMPVTEVAAWVQQFETADDASRRQLLDHLLALGSRQGSP